MEVNFIFRKKFFFFSIEGVFDTIIKTMPDEIIVKKTYLPYNRVTVISVFKNLVYVFKTRSKLNHITGDVHYASIVTGNKTILTIHDVNSTIQGNFFKKIFLKLLWFQIPALFVTKITVISEFTKSELIQIIPFAKNKICVIYNPFKPWIQFTKKKFNQEQPKVLHIGTTANKNLFRISEALKDLNCRLIVVGPLDEKQLESLTSNNITFQNVFNVSNDTIIELYNNCDIVSFPSLYEGFGMPIIEGNMAGRAVLTSNISSMPEIANDSACLVDPYDVHSIREGFLKIINDENYRETLIRNGFKNVSRFDPIKISREYVKLYHDVLQK